MAGVATSARQQRGDDCGAHRASPPRRWPRRATEPPLEVPPTSPQYAAALRAVTTDSVHEWPPSEPHLPCSHRHRGGGGSGGRVGDDASAQPTGMSAYGTNGRFGAGGTRWAPPMVPGGVAVGGEWACETHQETVGVVAQRGHLPTADGKGRLRVPTPTRARRRCPLRGERRAHDGERQGKEREAQARCRSQGILGTLSSLNCYDQVHTS